MRVLLVFTLLACGSSKAPSITHGPPAKLEATRASPDDVIVAQVNGRPVWGSCVLAQAHHGITKDAALHECIDFELMAQAAEKRGLAVHPQVIEATRTAMVSELVARAFEDRFQKPEELGGQWDALVAKNLWHIKHQNYRGSAYVRVVVPEKAAQATDDAAHATADKVAAALAAERGLSAPQLFELAQPIAGAVTLVHEVVPPYREGALDPGYATALFALAEVGRVTPKAVRTKWGWDVILYTEDVPATDPSQDEIVAKMLPEAKLAYFNIWINGLAQQLGVHVEIDQETAAKLEDLP